MMKDFTWKYFINSGDVDAYLLYKNFNEEQDVTEEMQKAFVQAKLQEMGAKGMGLEEA